MCNVQVGLQLFLLIILILQTSCSVSFTIGNFSRIRRQTDCPKPNFKCASGECIDGDKECDGAVDCRDASDESNNCQRIKCPSYLFTCKYGACISKELACDGKNDCRDGSDEDSPPCKESEDDSSKCKESEFRCSSGQCIDKDFQCDGKAECDDHSDEIKTTCWNVRCPGFAYRCNYGACVNGRAECNGVVDCFDGSDEDPTICKRSLPTPTVTTSPPPTVTKPNTHFSNGCLLPNHPEFGHWRVIKDFTNSYSPGMYVQVETVLKVECNKDYSLEGNDLLFCKGTQWSSPIGKCRKMCPPILSTATTKVTCIYNNREVENCTDAIDGTLAKFKCVPFYEDLSLKKSPIHICKDGSWDQSNPACEPVCGQKTVEATTLIVNGRKVNKGDYPWQVALYNTQNKQLICGGSLVNQRVIITAAHCITNSKGKLQSKENYIVAVGKYYRDFNDSRDMNEAQFSELEAMFVPPEYRDDLQNFLGDIGILITKKIFKLSRRVQPVCLDKGQNYNYLEENYGYVTGWGFTAEDSKPSDVLKELKVPSISISQCQSNLPEDYHVYLTHDKMCAGYIDNGTAVCKGDSGGGLVFKHDGRYYITGIVSISPNSPQHDGCDSQQYGLYTKVSNYMNNFILQKLAEFKT